MKKFIINFGVTLLLIALTIHNLFFDIDINQLAGYVVTICCGLSMKLDELEKKNET